MGGGGGGEMSFLAPPGEQNRRGKEDTTHHTRLMTPRGRRIMVMIYDIVMLRLVAFPQLVHTTNAVPLGQAAELATSLLGGWNGIDACRGVAMMIPMWMEQN